MENLSNVVVNTKEMKDVIKKIGYIKSAKGVEFLQGFYIEVKEGRMYIYKTNIENTLIYSIKLHKVDKDFKIRVNEYKTIAKAIKFMKGDFINITIKDKSIILSDNAKVMEVDCDGDVIELPDYNNIESKHTPCNNLLERLNEVDYAMAKDDIRPILKGVHFTKNDMVALDGYRLALSKSKELTIKNSFSVSDESVKVIKKITKDFKNDNISINISDNYVEWVVEGCTLITKKLEGKMFNYEDVIRLSHSNIFAIEQKEAKESLKYLQSFKSTKKSSNKINFVTLEKADDHLKWSSDNELGKFSSDTSIDVKKGTSCEKMAFDIDYITDAVNNIKSDFELCLDGSLDPAILERENSIHLVLPVRVSC